MTLGYYSGTGREEVEWVAAGHACRNCGRDLGGLHVSARCPQCGVPAGYSVFSDLLRFARPAWLGRVRAGLRLQFWTFIVAAALTVLFVVALMAIGMRAASAAAAAAATQPAAGTGGVATSWAVTSDGSESLMTWIGFGLTAVGGVLLTVSVWRITEPEPPLAGAPGATTGGGPGGRTRRTGTPARWARVAAAVTVIHVVGWGGVETALPGTAARPAVLVAIAILSLVPYVGWVALAYVLAALAVRAPDAGLAGRARVAAWGGAICGGLLEVLTLVFALAVAPAAAGQPDANYATATMMAGGCGLSILGLAVLGFFVVHLVTLGQLVSRVTQARAYAEQVWSGPAAPAIAPAAVPLVADRPHVPDDAPGQ